MSEAVTNLGTTGGFVDGVWAIRTWASTSRGGGGLTDDIPDDFDVIAERETWGIGAAIGHALGVVERKVAKEIHHHAGVLILEDQLIGRHEQDGAADDSAGVGGNMGGGAGDVRNADVRKEEWVGGGVD